MSEFEKVKGLLQELKKNPRAFFEQVPNHRESDILEYKASFEYDLALDLCPHVKKKPGWKPKNPALVRRVLETIVAFANTKGGLIIFGVDQQHSRPVNSDQCGSCIEPPLHQGACPCLEQHAQVQQAVVDGPLHICGINREVDALHDGKVANFCDRLANHFAFGTKGKSGDIKFAPAYYPCENPAVGGRQPLSVTIKTNFRWLGQVETECIKYIDDESGGIFHLYAILVKPADEPIIMSLTEKYANERLGAREEVFKVRSDGQNWAYADRFEEEDYKKARFHRKDNENQLVLHERGESQKDKDYWDECVKLGPKGWQLYLDTYCDGEFAVFAKLKIEELSCQVNGDVSLAGAPSGAPAPEPDSPERATDPVITLSLASLIAESNSTGPVASKVLPQVQPVAGSEAPDNEALALVPEPQEHPRTAKPARGEHTTRADFSPTATTSEDTTGSKLGDLLRAKISNPTANMSESTTPRNEQYASEQKAKKLICEAERYRFSGKLPQAIDCYTRAIRLKPDDANAVNALVQVYVARGASYKNSDFDMSIADYAEAMRLNPNCSEAINGLAYVYTTRAAVRYKRAKYDLAITDYTEAIRLQPSDALSYYYRAGIYENMGDYDNAIADYSEMHRLAPESCFPIPCLARVYKERGKICSKNGDHDQAIADYTEAIRLEPGDAMSYSCRANGYKEKGDHDKAIADYTEAIRLDPDSATAYNLRGNAYYKIGSYDHAITDYTVAISHKNSDEVLYFNRGHAHINKKDYDKAICDFTEAIRLNPDAITYCARAKCHETIKRYEEAVADYTEAIRLNPDAITYCARAKCHENIKRYEEAVADYTEAIRINPKCDLYYAARAMAYTRYRYNNDNSIADYTAAIGINPGDYRHYTGRAVCHLWRYDFLYAIEDYSEAIRIAPQVSTNYRDRANAYIASWKRNGPAFERAERYIGPSGSAASELMRCYSMATKDYAEAIKIDPKRIDYYISSADAHVLVEKYDLAITDYTEAIRIDNNKYSLFMARAAVYTMKNEYTQAIIDYTEVIRSDPHCADAFERRAELYVENHDFVLAYNDYQRALLIDASKNRQAQKDRIEHFVLKVYTSVFARIVLKIIKRKGGKIFLSKIKRNCDEYLEWSFVMALCLALLWVVATSVAKGIFSNDKVAISITVWCALFAGAILFIGRVMQAFGYCSDRVRKFIYHRS